jgi:hypothetical protein
MLRDGRIREKYSSSVPKKVIMQRKNVGQFCERKKRRKKQTSKTSKRFIGPGAPPKMNRKIDRKREARWKKTTKMILMFRILMLLGLPDPDSLVRGENPDQAK